MSFHYIFLLYTENGTDVRKRFIGKPYRLKAAVFNKIYYEVRVRMLSKVAVKIYAVVYSTGSASDKPVLKAFKMYIAFAYQEYVDRIIGIRIFFKYHGIHCTKSTCDTLIGSDNGSVTYRKA
jgi:hypothetical protein